jgi:hypothetical protein
LIYCTDDEFDKRECEVFNKYTRIQWLNNFHTFDKSPTAYSIYDQNEQGDLHLLAQKEENTNIYRYIYAFNSNGEGLIFREYDNKYISYKQSSYQLPQYIEKIKYIQISNEYYLFSFSKTKTIYIYNYNKDTYYEKELFPNIPYFFDSIQKIRDKENIYL